VQAAGPLLKPGASVVFLSSRGSRQLVPGYGAIGARQGARRSVRALSDAGAGGARRSHQLRRARNLGYAGRSRPVRAEHGRVPRAGGRRQSSGRNISHDDYTGLVKFLASPEAQMIQGQVIFRQRAVNT